MEKSGYNQHQREEVLSILPYQKKKVEKPNLSYINQLANNDVAFRKKLLTILKKEFPIEEKEFFTNFNTNLLDAAANNVHKIKHKIILLGLEDGHKTATIFEKELRKKITTNFTNFTIILKNIRIFLNQL